MPRDIFVLRHGETENNRLAIVQGSGIDGSLNETGQKQAKAFFEAYRNHSFNLIVTSSLQRTHQTVKAFIDLGIPWIQLPQINEMNWGIHEGKSYVVWMEKAYQEAIADWKKGKYDTRLEQGESAADLEARISWFVDWLHTRPESIILICSHGRAMRCMMTRFLHLPLSEMEQFTHKNTGLTHFNGEPGNYSVRLMNDTSHLEGFAGF